MRKILIFIAILMIACSNSIDLERKWANFMEQKYPSGIEHIVLTTLPEENDYTLDIKLKPSSIADFKNILQDIGGFLQSHPTRKSVLVIDTSKLDSSIVASIFTNAQAFRKSLKWIHYNYGTQDVEPGAGVKDIDPTLSLINKRNFPNLYHFSVALSGDKKTNEQNLQILKNSIDIDVLDKIDVDVVLVKAKKS